MGSFGCQYPVPFRSHGTKAMAVPEAMLFVDQTDSPGNPLVVGLKRVKASGLGHSCETRTGVMKIRFSRVLWTVAESF